jgi:hypothetical protein
LVIMMDKLKFLDHEHYDEKSIANAARVVFELKAQVSRTLTHKITPGKFAQTKDQKSGEEILKFRQGILERIEKKIADAGKYGKEGKTREYQQEVKRTNILIELFNDTIQKAPDLI